MTWCISIGCGFLFIAGLAVGAWTTGTQQRGNFHSEPESDSGTRQRVASWSAILGLICFAIAGLIYLFQ